MLDINSDGFIFRSKFDSGIFISDLLENSDVAFPIANDNSNKRADAFSKRLRGLSNVDFATVDVIISQEFTAHDLEVLRLIDEYSIRRDEVLIIKEHKVLEDVSNNSFLALIRSIYDFHSVIAGDRVTFAINAIRFTKKN